MTLGSQALRIYQVWRRALMWRARHGRYELDESCDAPHWGGSS